MSADSSPSADLSQGLTDPTSASSTSLNRKDQLRHEPITKIAEDIQKKTQDSQAHIRKGMKKKHDGNQNVVVFAKDYFATLAVTASDRASLGQRRILVKINHVPKDNCYELQCEFDTLQRKVTATSLNTVPEAIVRRNKQDYINVPKTVLPLSKAAALSSMVIRVAISCNCRKGCGT